MPSTLSPGEMRAVPCVRFEPSRAAGTIAVVPTVARMLMTISPARTHERGNLSAIAGSVRRSPSIRIRPSTMSPVLMYGTPSGNSSPACTMPYVTVVPSATTSARHSTGHSECLQTQHRRTCRRRRLALGSQSWQEPHGASPGAPRPNPAPPQSAADPRVGGRRNFPVSYASSLV